MVANRLSTRLAAVKNEGRTALISFIMGGDPDAATSQQLLNALPGAGVDVIELGMPFSDPMADGKAIQAAAIRALKAGTTLRKVLAQVEAFRKTDDATPIVLMGYLNPVEHFGYEAFFTAAQHAGVDGMILVDLPPEEDAPVRALAEKANIAIIRLVAPTTLGQRLNVVLDGASGFVYTIAVAGITGDKAADESLLASQVTAIRSGSELPVAAGFGIRTPEQAKRIAKSSGADAIVVGSAIVDALANDGVDAALTLVRDLSAALR
jgi:tryptophan synthase alpha chain